MEINAKFFYYFFVALNYVKAVMVFNKSLETLQRSAREIALIVTFVNN